MSELFIGRGRKLLDYGLLRGVDCMGSDLSISRAARVSYAAPPRPEDHKLIHSLWRDQHTSPFEHVVFTFEVGAPIFVFRQWHRHRTWSYSELSARYRPLSERFYVPEPEMIGYQHPTNKQARLLGAEMSHDQLTTRMAEATQVRQQNEKAFALYRQLLANGWPRELARSHLPVSTYSDMFATVNLHNLFRFITLRKHEHAQYEIRVYAEAMLELIQPVVPIAVDAFVKAADTNGRIAEMLLKEAADDGAI